MQKMNFRIRTQNFLEKRDPDTNSHTMNTNMLILEKRKFSLIGWDLAEWLECLPANAKVATVLHCKKTGQKFNRCLESYLTNSFFHQCCTKIVLVTTVFFVNHTGRKKNFDAADGNKSYPSVKEMFPLYLLE